MNLTTREKSVLQFLLQGKTNKQIAAELGISDYTVRDHVSSLLFKSECSNRTELISRYLSSVGYGSCPLQL